MVCTQGPCCAGVTERLITQYSDMEDVLQSMQENRVTTATSMNSTSSRSHALIRLSIESHAVQEGEEGGIVSLQNAVHQVQNARGYAKRARV